MQLPDFDITLWQI